MRRLLFPLLLLCAINSQAQFNRNIEYLFIGTAGKEIHVLRFNLTNGTSSEVSSLTDVESPTYLSVTKDQKFLYAVNETSGEQGGSLSAFSFDKGKGILHFLNKTPSGGDGPCYVETDSTGKWVVAANYGGGSLSIFKTGADGSLLPFAQNVEHQGYSVNFTRQSKPHVHCTVFSPDNKYVFATDLGTDKVYRYTFNPGNPQPLSETDTVMTDVPDGFGPRHFVFHPTQKSAYLINELSGQVIAYQCTDNKLTEIQTIESTREGDKLDKGSADIRITPDGKYLYTSNRGKANDLTIYRVGSTGLLTLVGHQSCLGAHPRNFAIDPTSHFLFVANRDTNNIEVFTIIRSTGFLQPVPGSEIHIDKPMCIKIIQ